MPSAWLSARLTKGVEMSSPTGEGAQGGATGAQGGTGAGTETGTTGDPSQGQTGAAQGGSETGQGQQTGQETSTVSRADFETLKRQLQAADQNRTKAEADLKALKDAQLTESERTKQHLEEAKAEITKLQQQLNDERISNAFLTDNTYEWHDPRAALKLADRTNVKVAEDGTVTGLKEALKAVADANAWMLKPKAEGEGGAAKDDKGKTGNTGVSGAAGKSGQGNQSDLEKRFPQLRGRVT